MRKVVWECDYCDEEFEEEAGFSIDRKDEPPPGWSEVRVFTTKLDDPREEDAKLIACRVCTSFVRGRKKFHSSGESDLKSIPSISTPG